MMTINRKKGMYFMKKHMSYFLNDGIKGHSNYEFVDIDIYNDNLLFIDPILIDKLESNWEKDASKSIQSFFDSFFDAYIKNDDIRKKNLLSHAREQNGTRLGYGRGYNGKGNTYKGLLDIFSPLEKLMQKIPNIGKAEDLSIMIPGFAEDGLSDMLTNILHDKLNTFTLKQIDKYGLHSNGYLDFYGWDSECHQWKEMKKPAYFIDGKEILLVPKKVVRKNYLFNTGQYFNRIILERMQKDGEYMDGDRPISKKEIIKSKRFSGDHWQYDECISYTEKNNDALDEYHNKLPMFYSENGYFMPDEKLDSLIY